MKVHHLNCATFCPLGRYIIPGIPTKLVCHCLLIETSQGLVLVDTGLGLKDIEEPGKRLGHSFLFFASPKIGEATTAHDQIKKLGLNPNDVRHIILTHLDLDHAGGMADFPNAKVHLYGAEYIAAMAPTTLIENKRYRSTQWSHSPKWEIYLPEGEKWLGFDCVRNLKGLPPEILLIPLVGHSLGHCGVAVETPEGWLLHAGDAYFHRKEMDTKKPKCPWSLKIFQSLLQADLDSRIDNQARLREVKAGGFARIFCSHDPVEFAEFTKPV